MKTDRDKDRRLRETETKTQREREKHCSQDIKITQNGFVSVQSPSHVQLFVTP